MSIRTRKQQRLTLRQVLCLGALGDIWLRSKEALKAADECMQRIKYLDACLRVSMGVERHHDHHDSYKETHLLELAKQAIIITA